MLSGRVVLSVIFLTHIAGADSPPRQREKLGRGVIAVPEGNGKVLVSWRLTADDAPGTAFNIYRSTEGAEAVKLTDQPLTGATCYEDAAAPAGKPCAWFVKPVVNAHEQAPSAKFSLPADPKPWLSIPLQTPDGYKPNDASAADLDGDGEYEIILHQAGRGRDNSQAGMTDPPILEAYRLDGTRLWRIQLGKNIREGAHYVTFMAFDFDGDGRAEVACKTADGTIDGTSKVIGDANADWRSKTGKREGRILDGPEFLTIFDGKTGAALATTDYIPPRGDVSAWGDDYGNRVDRFLACVAYLDGMRPSLVMCRGYYTRTVLAAWDWRDGKLTHRWTFDSDAGDPKNRTFRGQGNHNLSVGDVDGDGRDEIIYGSCVIDDNGTGLYSTGFGHGDAMHFSDIDPDRPGLEVFKANGDKPNAAGIQLRDAKTGAQIFGIPCPGAEGVPRACALDIDPRHRGFEMWAKGQGVGGLYDVKGIKFSPNAPRTCNMGIWWDADPLRELLNGVTVTKWDWEKERETPLFDGRDNGCVSINGSKSNPCLCADLLGDWREEIVAATRDGRELRIFSTPIPAKHRLVTLMHDPVYRLGIAWQNTGYNQPAHTSFFMGDALK
jgi:rhamnogalacturonan endolyase